MIVKDKNDFYANRYMRHNKVTGSFTLYSVHLPNGENVRFFVDAGESNKEKTILDFTMLLSHLILKRFLLAF